MVPRPLFAGVNLASMAPGRNSGRQMPSGDCRNLAPEPIDLVFHQLDQFADGIAIEGEPGPRGRVDVGQRTRVAEGQRIAVAAHRLHRVTQAVPPDLQRAKLGK